MKRLTFLTVLCLLPVLGFAEEDKGKVKHVDAEQAAKLVQEGKVSVLDVRTADEFKEGHIKGATNADMLSKDFTAQVEKLDKSKPILVHCQAGSRSTRALPKLEKLGFTEIYHLDGGINDWQKVGKPVVK